MLESLFNKAVGLQHKCFPVNIAKLLRTPILKIICERMLLETLIRNTFLVYSAAGFISLSIRYLKYVKLLKNSV